MVVSGSDDGMVRLWEVATGKKRGQFKGHQLGVGVTSIAISPDGRIIVAADGGGLVLFDTQTGKLLARCVGHKEPVRALAFSPDGKPHRQRRR